MTPEKEEKEEEKKEPQNTGGSGLHQQENDVVSSDESKCPNKVCFIFNTCLYNSGQRPPPRSTKTRTNPWRALG
jgi:hypothetical protein